MKPYKFKFEDSELTPQEIAQHKDFDGLLEKLSAEQTVSRKRNFVRNGLIAAAVLVVATGGYMLYQQNNSTTPSTVEHSTIETNTLQTELVIEEAPAQEFTIDSRETSKIVSEQGKKITVPANSFVDGKGNDIKGEINIDLKEFEDPIEVFAAGIPTKVEGTDNFVETGSMLEINATAEGKPVFFKENTRLEVEMPGSVQGAEYEIMHLQDDLWTAVGTENAITNQRRAELDQELEEARAKLDAFDENKLELPELPTWPKLVKPAQPTLANTEKSNYMMNIPATGFEELSYYKNIKWEFVDEFSYNKMTDESVEKVEEIKVVKNVQNKYLVKFVADDKTDFFEVIPVFVGEDYTIASEIYTREKANYLQQISHRSEKTKEINDQRAAIIKNEKAKLQNEVAQLEDKIKMEAEVVNAFEIDGFGVWNSGQVATNENTVEISIRFKNSEGEDIVPSTVYLVERGQNTLFYYSQNSFDGFRFDPTKDNLMWTVLAENKLGIFYPRDFKEIDINSGSHVFVPTVIEGNWKNVEDLKTILMFDQPAASTK